MSSLPTWLKTTGAALLSRLAGFALMAFVFCQFFFAELPSRAVVINRELGISGQVTICSNSRENVCFLDSSRVRYNFMLFRNEQLAPAASLSDYLQPGDSVAKQPQTTYLLLWRHHQLSRWQLVPPRP